MPDTAPDFERALWTAVDHIVKLYDDELIAQEWPEEVNFNGRLHRAGVALAVWYKARWPLNRNDAFHYAGYYTREESSAAEQFLAVMKLLNYDHENRATNFAEVRDQLDDPSLLGPYLFLQRIIPLLNERGITLQIGEILDTLSPWLDHDQVMWLTDDPGKPDFVALYSTGMDAQLNPTERVITLHWATIVAAMRLFLPTESCEHIRRNGEGRDRFMAVLVPYQALADSFGH